MYIHLADIHIEDKTVRLIRYDPPSIANLFGCFISIHPPDHPYSAQMQNVLQPDAQYVKKLVKSKEIIDEDASLQSIYMSK